ncbi:MAG: YbbR-like domain-containing protein [Firmicutes bacterium]|jgi:hypothetical protein|nr:hypothetical protein [Bacillota bacterium]NLL88975.1 YbbR-like domain-containing protein [Bacillota bacterium]HKM17308.1 hypothetical protein [Limnochordia bacterium]
MNRQQWRSFAQGLLRKLQVLFRDEDLYYRFFALFLAIILWSFAGGYGRLVAIDQHPAPAVVAVIPRFSGELAPGLGLQSFVVIPQTLTANVPPGLAGTLEALVTEPIQLTGLAAGEYDLSIGVIKPAGVEIVGSSTVQVKLVVAATQ